MDFAARSMLRIQMLFNATRSNVVKHYTSKTVNVGTKK